MELQGGLQDAKLGCHGFGDFSAKLWCATTGKKNYMNSSISTLLSL